MADDANVADTAASTADTVGKVIEGSPTLHGSHPILYSIGKVISHIDPHVFLWDCVGIAILLWIFFVFRKIHHSPKYNNIDFTDMLVDKSTNSVSGSKLKLIIASVVLTWAFVYLTLDGKLTEWFTAVYIGAFLTDRITSRIYGDNPTVQGAKSVTVSTTKSESTVISDPDDDELTLKHNK